MGEFMNDERFKRVFASPETMRLAYKFEAIVECEIRNVLDLLGCNFNRDTDISIIENQMKLMSIDIKKHTFPLNPDDNGWYVYQHGKLLIIISEPWIDKKGNIKIKRRVIK